MGTFCRVFACGLAAVALALLSSPGASGRDPSPIENLDDCPGIQTDHAPRPQVGAFGRVALPRFAAPGERIETAPFPGGRRYAKLGLHVRGAQPVTLSVDSPASITGWRASEDLTNEVTLSQGSRCRGTGWHWFPGGLVVPKPGSCVDLSITVGNETRVIPFGLDKRCKSAAQRAEAATPWADLHRPLDLPSVQPGETCPVSTVDERVDWPPINIFGGSGIGRGPAYPGLGSEPTADLFLTPAGRGWLAGKVFWYVKPSYRDRVLIRGARLDGSGPMRFTKSSPRRTDELRLNVGETLEWDGQPPGSRGMATGSYVRSTGCYGFRIDGANFSRTVVVTAST